MMTLNLLMPNPQERASSPLAAALRLGVLGAFLLYSAPWGINLLLWLVVAAASGWAVLPNANRPRYSPWPVALALFFAACVAWRAAPFLMFWNIVAVLAALALPALRDRRVRYRVATLTDYAAAALTTAWNTATGVFRYSREDFGFSESGSTGPRIRATAVGIALAVPVTIVFGGLLRSADPGFASLTRSLFPWDLAEFNAHFLLGGVLTGAAAGYFRPLAVPSAGSPNTILAGVTGRMRLGLLELAIPLGALVATFALFVAMQLRYLFGGAVTIASTPDLTLATYARHGFMEITTATALALPTLLMADWTLDARHPRQVNAFRWLAASLIGLLGLVMVSALHRVHLYTAAYGLTEIRLYATVFMLWIGVLLVGFAATVLRGHRQRFAFVGLVSGFAVLAGLNLADPEDIIVRTHLTRFERGEELDAEYLSRLSADAAPPLADALPALPAATVCVLTGYRAVLEERPDGGDWRGWNRARSRASRLRRAAHGYRPAECHGNVPGDGPPGEAG